MGGGGGQATYTKYFSGGFGANGIEYKHIETYRIRLKKRLHVIRNILK